MNLKQLLKNLKVSGVKLTEVADRTGINIHTLYSITSGRQVSKEKEKYIIALLHSIYNKELARIDLLRTISEQKEME